MIPTGARLLHRRRRAFFDGVCHLCSLFPFRPHHDDESPSKETHPSHRLPSPAPASPLQPTLLNVVPSADVAGTAVTITGLN